ncbi:hypothetical protein LTR56_015731 [Elasticomyces elasticus]|nr:hypothetical protein LTR56_015731 [Elasticomyces elasticus]KAK3659238.1 hypothetical protein LTR22_008505 [Elasticomyces elasticus]KAK4914764.1 hypothetical protein LTR49_016999 [Elasticomyces elasticus]KAK5754234.1 hypothetical protein LTS12_015644 [Elasticomyces elasticus]
MSSLTGQRICDITYHQRARTLQTARKSTGGKAPRKQLTNGDADDSEHDDLKLDEETIALRKAIEEGEMRAELKHLDKKHTDKGVQYYAETVDEEVPEQVNWWSKFALCLVRHMDGSNKHVQSVCLQINSKHLKDILKNTIGSFPGISFHTKDITIPRPYHALFHYRNELEKVGEDLEENSEAATHLDLLLDWINEEFKDTIDEFENLSEQGMMTYSSLWTVFRPGAMMYAPVFGQARAFKLDRYEYVCGDNPGLLLYLEYVDFDGEDFGTRNTSRLVGAFRGSERITELTAFPIARHSDAEAVKAELIERAHRFEQHAGMHFYNYKGVALEYTSCGINRYNTEGRVVVDTKTYHRLNSNHSFTVSPFKSDEDKQSKRRKIRSNNLYDSDDDENEETLDLVPQDKLELDPLTDEQCLLANAMVRGFSFAEKRWFDFFVDRLSPPGWDAACFDKLVLPPAQKDLVRALVTTHSQNNHDFDDIVKGKGKGLIMVLHGPPGVGKTLTAETVAEYCERPLYMVSSGDLGTNASELDGTLTRILDMASTWKAVLLIDEADVFLERRSLHDYYEGILFLTSNRVNTFDDAFKSRIHVPLKYNDLTAESRKKIWKNFLSKMEGGVELDEDGYDRLAQANINGRQIKNVIRTAKSLAQYHGEKLDRAKLEQVIKIQEEFEQEMDLTNGADDGKGDMANGHRGGY